MLPSGKRSMFTRVSSSANNIMLIRALLLLLFQVSETADQYTLNSLAEEGQFDGSPERSFSRVPRAQPRELCPEL